MLNSSPVISRAAAPARSSWTELSPDGPAKPLTKPRR